MGLGSAMEVGKGSFRPEADIRGVPPPIPCERPVYWE